MYLRYLIMLNVSINIFIGKIILLYEQVVLLINTFIRVHCLGYYGKVKKYSGAEAPLPQTRTSNQNREKLFH